MEWEAKFKEYILAHIHRRGRDVFVRNNVWHYEYSVTEFQNEFKISRRKVNDILIRMMTNSIIECAMYEEDGDIRTYLRLL